MVIAFYIALISTFGVFAAIFSAYCVYGLAVDFHGAERYFVLPLQIGFAVVLAVFAATLIVFAVKKPFKYGKKPYIAGLAVKVFGYVAGVFGIITVIDYLLLLRRPDTSLGFGVFNSFVFAVIVVLVVVPRVTEFFRNRFGVLVEYLLPESKTDKKSDKKSEKKTDKESEKESEEITEPENG